MGVMPCRVRASAWSGLSRRASSPPWTFGCRVLTRPSIISGKPVTRSTGVTSSPASVRARAVPPVEISRAPCWVSARAKATRSALSLTESRAVRMGTRSTFIASRRVDPHHLAVGGDEDEAVFGPDEGGPDGPGGDLADDAAGVHFDDHEPLVAE